MAKRKVFFSFHYHPDGWRASQVRNIGVLEGNQPASDNDWEQVKNGGDSAIQKWIDSQLTGRSCTVVLIGQGTANRKWINYEITKSWEKGMGILGIYIHGLKNRDGVQAAKGSNPLDYTWIGSKKLSDMVRAYDTPFATSAYVYDHIAENIAAWLETGIAIRNSYPS
jgi:MTH538 TIR-like domain (DUF1863)